VSWADWAATHRRSVLAMALIFGLGGIAAALGLPVALFPHVDFPRVVVSLEAGDQPSEQMVITVTRPVEQAVRSVPGVVGVRSTSSRGSAEISINFTWGTEMVSAMLQVESAITQAAADLPTGTQFDVRRMDPTVFPVAAYSLTSARASLIQLRELGEYTLVPLLSSIAGVSAVTTLGGETAEYQVLANVDRMQALGIDFDTLANAISRNNVLQSVGRVQDEYKLFLMLSDTRFNGADDIKNTLIPNARGGFVALRDIADVSIQPAPQWIKVTADTHDAVLLQIYQQPGGNTVQIVREIQKKITAFQDKLPADVKIANWYDQSELIKASAKSVMDAIGIGVILAALVLLLFLKNLKITLVAVLIVPAVLASTVLLLQQQHMSFNIMTLGGMAAAVGLIVDDAIVMLEHIVRRLREQSGAADACVQRAALEFTKPLAGSSAATIVIFAPLAFLSGVTGAFFKALSLTMASSLVISFLFAWQVVPLVADKLLSVDDAKSDDIGPWLRRILESYEVLMFRLQRNLWPVFISLIALFVLGAWSFLHVGSGFMPTMDEGGFILDYRAAAGTSLAETDRLLRQVEAILQAHPAVATYSRRTGVQLGGGLTEANEGDMFIRLKPLPRPPISDIMDELRTRIETEVPGLEIELILLMEDLIGDLTAVPQPIEIKLYSDDYTALAESAPRVAEHIAGIRGVVDVNDGVVLAGDAIRMIVDHEKAAVEGLEPEQVTAQLQTWLDGRVVSQIQGNVSMLNIRLWIPAAERNQTDYLDTIPIRAADGHMFPFRHIGHIEKITGQPQIIRDNLKRMLAVTARISGRDMGSTVSDVKRALEKKGILPNNVYYELGGLYQQQRLAFHDLTWVFVAALSLLFVLLLYLYENIVVAISILLAPLFSCSAVFIGLWLTHTDLNITGMMGMTMILGIVTEVSIFYFSEYFELRAKGVSHGQAVVRAGTNRFRPILMTTLAAILALLPLSLALGQGAEMQQPLAIAITSGLLVQIPLVLIVMPVMFSVLSRHRSV